MIDKYEWHTMSSTQVQPIIDLINPIAGKHYANSGTAQVRCSFLPFYDELELVEVSDSSWPSGTGPFWFIAKDEKMFLLDGSSAPIHDANEAAPVKINDGSVLAYLDFFCFFVHGDEGPFLIVEYLPHPAIDTAKMDDEMKQTVENAIVPAHPEYNSETGNFEVSAVVLYSDNLFSAQFTITKTGMIEMSDDIPLIASVPVIKIKPNY